MVTSKQLLELLESKEQLKQQLALSLPARPETWRSILKNHPHLAFTLAQNKSLPQDLADELTQHVDPKVRLMIAKNGDLSFAGFQQLLDDPEAAVRLTLAKRQDLEPQFVPQLLADSDSGVRLAAKIYQTPVFTMATASGW